MESVAYRTIAGPLPRRALRALTVNRWLVAGVLAYALLTVLTTRGLGLADPFAIAFDAALRDYIMRLVILFALIGAAFVLGHVLHVVLFERPEQPLMVLRESFFTVHRMPERIVTGLPVLLLLPVCLALFSALKVLIPAIHPFDWDAAFIAWDRWLHGGVDPWQILQPLLGYPFATHIVDILYTLWFFVLFLCAFVMAFKLRGRRLRMQFFLTLLITWAVLGNGMAAAFASVGPCFYGLLTGAPDPFAPLMAYLHHVDGRYPLAAVQIQEVLWQAHEMKEIAFGRGISAMPSIHVSTALLFFLLWRRMSRLMGAAMGVFFLAILLGSVHLGYHYAIDGYVSIVLTVAIWWGVGFVLDRDRGLDDEPEVPAVSR
ncbi:MAG: hypothetical protein GY791_10045 [Alphaproteobacteria bacterium]|nr:hypothetical protein [Alphaproteobacteria bacterium]